MPDPLPKQDVQCAVPFVSGCPTVELYCFPCEPEPSLEHVGLKCTTCGLSVSATRERKDWCATMARPKSKCGCPDCGSSIAQYQEGV